MDNIFSFFAQNISTLGDPYRHSDWGSDILDKSSIDFIRTFNGAYFFDNSLHFFRVGYKSVIFHDAELINGMIRHYYSDFVYESIFFAEDIFGNLFGIETSGDIILFNIESAEKEIISNGFSNYLNAIFNELDYYTGNKFATDTEVLNQLNKGYRFCPKYPFVLGGEYDLKNLVLKPFEENYIFNSNLAKQIKEQPDGTNFKISIH